MSATGGGLGRMSSILNGLRLILSRSPVNHVAVRHFYLQPACEAIRKVEMPSLSPTMEMGTIVKWHKKEGDSVSPGDVLCDIQTDKAVVSMEYEDEGVLAKILKPDNSADIRVGSLIALMVDEGEDWKGVVVPTEAEAPCPAPQAQRATAPPPLPQPAVPTPAAAAAAVAASQPAAAAAPALPREPARDPTEEDWHLVGPAVRKLLDEYEVSVTEIPRSGPRGSLLKGDLLAYVESRGIHKKKKKKAAEKSKLGVMEKLDKPEPEPGKNYIDIPLTKQRMVANKRLLLAKTTIPHAYSSIDCGMSAILKLRQQLNEQGSRLSVNDFIIKAAGYALEKSPKVNALWDGNDAQPAETIDIAVAVATDFGLITPIVIGVPSLGVAQISLQMKNLADKARAGILQSYEYRGGTFTLSNLGMYGVREFSGIVQHPQVAFLAIGTLRLDSDENSIFSPRMLATLSFDNRVVNERDAAHFLETFRSALEHPDLLMVGSVPGEKPEFAAESST